MAELIVVFFRASSISSSDEDESEDYLDIQGIFQLWMLKNNNNNIYWSLQCTRFKRLIEPEGFL